MVRSRIFLISNTDSRDCPDYYILNPQYPITGPECFPEDFIFNNSSNQAFYYFQSIEIDLDYWWIDAIPRNDYEEHVTCYPLINRRMCF